MNQLVFFDGLAALAGGVLLIAAGVALIVHGANVRKEQRERRFELAQSRPAAAAAEFAPRADYTFPSTLLTPVSREIIRRLGRLGIAAENALATYQSGRLALAALVAAFAALAALSLFPAVGIGAALAGASGAALAAWIAPAALLRRFVRRRAARAASGLPDALELLVVCVEAGLSLEDGIARAVGELRHSQPALAEELALTAADLKILPSRDQALLNLAERIDVPSVRSLVTTLSQTLRYGTPLVQALRSAATELRNAALLRIEERANQLPVMLTIPMMLFIMPTIFLVVGGPAGLRIVDIFLR